MKTKVEINGYEIEIEEKDGLVSVVAKKDDEVIEEFTLEGEGGVNDSEEVENDEVKGFDEFEEEEDLENDEEVEETQNENEEEEEDEEDEEDEFEGKLESFQSFINKRK
jgi:hypothetical protein